MERIRAIQAALEEAVLSKDYNKLVQAINLADSLGNKTI
jgi:hypothetical protein